MEEKQTLVQITEKTIRENQSKISFVHVTNVNFFYDYDYAFPEYTLITALKKATIKRAPPEANAYLIGKGVEEASGRRRGGTLYHAPVLYLNLEKRDVRI